MKQSKITLFNALKGISKEGLVLVRYNCVCYVIFAENVLEKSWRRVTTLYTVPFLFSELHVLSSQIAGYVNQPMVDVSILQRSLAILESMVLNSHSLYHRVAQEITVGQLIGHLQV